jgi:mono/diheme cytochrome c family protein
LEFRVATGHPYTVLIRPQISLFACFLSGVESGPKKIPLLREEAVVLKSVAIIPACLLLGAVPLLFESPAPQATSGTFKVPPDIAAQTNPVKATPEGLAKAKKMYGYDCAMCHGANGDGKGDLAVESKFTIKDWNDPAALKDLTDGELFYIIQKGKGDNMPGEGDRQKPDEIWNTVTLVRSFAKK